MLKLFLLPVATFCAMCAYSQNSFQAYVRDAESKEPLVGATVFIVGTANGSTTNSEGLVTLDNIGDGNQVLVFRYVGYKERADTFLFPLPPSKEMTIYMQGEGLEMEEVVVSTTRSSRTIEDIPTRVESITASELDEKASMQPANVKMILTESTGIQTQQTSATSANASIRIQGLDGKYTQLLKDGFPLYSGFSGGLSIMQIPPLDLKRVEVVKGSSSTLSGGGAIAGIINFITKVPTEKRELSFLVNANQTKALDVSGYYSQKFKKIGITLFASQNLQAAYDANGDGLSDIPQFTRYNLNPRIFYYLDKTTTLSFGINSTLENRLGGDMKLIGDGADSVHSYYERNITARASTQLKFEKVFADKSILTFKNSVGYFDRGITKSDYVFGGKQFSSFSELNCMIPRNKLEWVFGGNFVTDHFEQTNATDYPLDLDLIVAGAFIQNSFIVTKKFIVESSVRTDFTNQGSSFVLPKLSAMYKLSGNLTARIGGGLGYKTPTIFSEEAAERSFRNIEPLNFQHVKPENSIGGNIDINYKAILFDKVSFSINQLFFYTRLAKPLVLGDSALPNGNYEFVNADGYLDSKGFETNLKLRYDEVSFYCGYTFIDAVRHFGQTETINPLTARHRIYMTLMYEIEAKLRIGYELFYTGRQRLSDGEARPGYWLMGISAEYRFNHFSLFVNAENFTDTRQTRYEGIYTGSLQNPQFKEIWSPTDGFILNGGFKINVW